MKPHEFEALKKEVALELARKTLESAYASKWWTRPEGAQLLTEEQNDTLDWLEMLYYDGEITYRQLWELSTGRC